MSANAESEAQGMKGLLEVSSLEVPAESVGTVEGTQMEMQQRSYKGLILHMRANGTVSRLVLEVGDGYGLGPKPQQVRGRAPCGEIQRRSRPKPEYFCILDSQFRLKFCTLTFRICEKVSRPAILTNAKGEVFPSSPLLDRPLMTVGRVGVHVDHSQRRRKTLSGESNSDHN